MTEKQGKPPVEEVQEVIPDEDTHLFIFGNLKITEKETGEVLVNKRF